MLSPDHSKNSHCRPTSLSLSSPAKSLSYPSNVCQSFSLQERALRCRCSLCCEALSLRECGRNCRCRQTFSRPPRVFGKTPPASPSRVRETPQASPGRVRGGTFPPLPAVLGWNLPASPGRVRWEPSPLSPPCSSGQLAQPSLLGNDDVQRGGLVVSWRRKEGEERGRR